MAKTPFTAFWIALVGFLGLVAPDLKAQGPTAIRVETPGIPSFAVVRPGRQTVLRTAVSNGSEKVVEGQVVVWLTEFPNLRFGHSFRLDPGQRRQLLVPIFIPVEVPAGRTLEARMRVDTDENVDVKSDSGVYDRVFENIFLEVTDDATTTMLLLEPRKPDGFDWDWRPDSKYYTYEAVVASRLQVGLSRRMVSSSHNPLPVDAATWDGFESAVLASDEFLEDAAAVAAIQNWIMRGGKLWVMLDQVDPSRINGLMGDSFAANVVEDIQLDRVQIQTTENTNAGRDDLDYRMDPPVRFRRISHSGGQVTHRIQGWPAVIWVRMGQGEVMLSTLDARAWIKPMSAAVPRQADPSMMDRFGPGPGFGIGGRRGGRPLVQQGEPSESSEPLTEVGSRTPTNPQIAGLSFAPTMTSEHTLRAWVGTVPVRLHAPRSEPKYVNAIESVASEQVGLRGLSRTTIAAGLMAFIALLGFACVWVVSKQHVERIGWLAPLIGLLVSAPTILYSMANKQSVYPQSSVVQIVDATAGLQQADVTDYMAVYQSTSAPLRFESTSGGDLFPGKRLLGDVQMDRTQDDLDRWRIGSDRWPVGIWNMRAKSTYRGDLPTMTAVIGKSGLEIKKVDKPGSEASKFDGIDDLLLFFPPASAVIPRKSGDDFWQAGIDDYSDGESWLNGTTVDDRRLRRQKIYRALFESDSAMKESTSPYVLGWGEMADSEIGSEPNLPRSGQALLMSRLTIRSPTEGSFIVPGWTMAVDARDRAGFPSSAFRGGKWFYPLANALEADLRFTWPISIPNAKFDYLRMRMRMFAPGRSITILHVDGDQEVELQRTNNPNGLQDWKWTKPSLLSAASKGSIQLRFIVSDIQDEDEDEEESEGPGPRASEWKIMWMQLDSAGTVP